MTLCDFENGVPVGMLIYFSLSDLSVLLIAMFGISHLSERVPDLNGAKILTKYSVIAVLSACFVSAFLGAVPSRRDDYWLQWTCWFFSNALAFLTVTPAVLSWVREGREWSRRPRNYVEFAALMTSLLFFGYFAFIGNGRWGQPALLYSLVPLLLWAALRLGLKGVSTSMLVVVLLSIWGAANGRGPFADQRLLNNGLSLLSFWFFAAIPFTVLAVLVEEQKRAQKALRDEHGQLMEAQNLAQMGSWQWDTRTGTVTWSRELYRIAGLDPKTPPPRYEELPRFYTAESWEQLQRAVEKALSAGTSYELDLEIVRPDGAKRWVRTRGQAHRDAAGHVIRLHGTGHDITERKLAETEIALANDRLRLAMESGKSMGWEWDIKSGQDSWFGDLQSIFGIASSYRAGRVEDFYRCVHPQDRERVGHAVREAMRTHSPYAAEFRILWSDGTVRWVAARGNFYYSPDGEPERMLGMAVDITDRKRADEALRESEERFRLVADTAPALIWMSGTDKLCNFFNKGWLDFTGRSIDLELGNGWTEGVHPEDLYKCLNTYVRAFDARQRFSMEYRLRRYDGEYRWILDIGAPRFNHDGSFAGYIGSCVDVTDRKLAEETLSGVNRKLIEAQERERTRIARELHDDVGQRLALLAVGLGQLQQSSAHLPDEVRSRVGTLWDQVASLTSDVQSLSHELHSSKLEYLGIVTAMKGFCKEFCEKWNVEVVFTHDEVRRDVPQEISLCLFRVLQEALHNAVKHSGVRQFDVDVREASNEIQLTVRDSGSGFALEEIVKTSGLGLTSMSERVKLAGGRFSIDSQPQLGTTVRATAPLSAGTKSMRAKG